MKLRDKVIKKEAFDSRNGWGMVAPPKMLYQVLK